MGLEVVGDGWNEGGPGAGVGVDEVVVVEGRISLRVGVGVSKDEVDDDIGRYIDGDPGDRVLARKLRGDLAEIFGAGYSL